jgi:hypothetical protein
MNIHDCIRCKNPINYDDTDWCDVCDMSIFDDRMVERKKVLTIKNFKSSLLNSWWGGWKITDVLEDVYGYDNDLNIIPPKQYTITFHYYRADGLGGPKNIGRLILERETDVLLAGKYRYRIYLNQKKINEGGVSKNLLEDKTAFIESVVSTLDWDLRK